jgi:hypothetical protein
MTLTLKSVRPIPTKPRPKAKRKGKARGMVRYVLRWFTLTGQTLSLESGDRAFLQGIINAGFPGKIISLPAPAGKSGGT